MQFSDLLCTSNPEFENIAPERPYIQNNTFCVHSVVLITLKLGLGPLRKLNL